MRSGDKILVDMVDTNDDGVIPFWQETANGEQKKSLKVNNIFSLHTFLFHFLSVDFSILILCSFYVLFFQSSR